MAEENKQEIFKYPIGIDDGPFENCIMFFINEPESVLNTDQQEAGDGTTLESLDMPESFSNIELFSTAAGNFSNYERTVVNNKCIQLYVPNGIEFNSGFGWSREDLGSAASMAYLAGDISQNSGGDLESTLDQLGSKETANRVKGEIIDSLVEVAGSVGNAVGISGQDASDRVNRKTQNNNQEVLFKNVGGREFSFNFHFLPRNGKEAQTVYDIIHLFRLYSHPKLSETTETAEAEEGEDDDVESNANSYARWLQYPAQFQPKFLYKAAPDNWQENRTMPKIGQCAVTNIKLEYGPNEFSIFDELIRRGPLPTEIKMSISLIEMQVLNRQRIRDGF